MAWLRVIFMLFLVAQLANCFLGARRSRKVYRRQNELRPCQEMSEAVGGMLSYARALVTEYSNIPGLGGPGAGNNELPEDPFAIFESIAEEFLVGFDVFDSEDRERAVCSLEGVETLSQLIDVYNSLELDYTDTRLGYNYVAISLGFGKSAIDAALENPQVWQNVHDLQLQANVMDGLIAAGILDVDDVGQDMAFAVAKLFAGDAVNELDIGIVPRSTEPIDEQCAQFTDDFRRLWNNMIRIRRKHDPNVSQETRAIIRNYTGIEMTDHETIQGYICNFFGAFTSNDGIEALTDLFNEMQVWHHALKTSYPILQEYFPLLLQSVRSVTNLPESNQAADAYGPGGAPGSGSGPGQIQLTLFQSFETFMVNFEKMGLLELEDDLYL